jgi:site-specific DNA-methyltransferase (adenine-specific)
MINITNEDCMKLMARYPDKYFELAIVDPPFGINAGKKKQYHKGAFTSYEAKEWDSNIPDKSFFDELFRVSQEQIIWGANYFTEFLPPKKNWIVWDKLQPDGVSFSMHELAYYSGNGQAKIFRGYNGANRCVNKKLAQKYIRIHQTQKPVLLYQFLLHNYAKIGDKILDTHLGSGSIAIACHDYGFDLTACDLDTDYYNAAMKRIAIHTAQLKLF